MEEKCEIIFSWRQITYDFSRYVIIRNAHCEDSKEVINLIYEEAPYRILSSPRSNLNWTHITIKYPNKRIAIREANYLYRKSQHHQGFTVVMASHMLAHFTKLEVNSTFFAQHPTYLVISNFPEWITPKRWKTILPKFGTVVVVRHERASNGELSIVVKYPTLSEALGVGIALHEHVVDGKKLSVRTYQNSKEHYLLDAYQREFEQCVCLTKNCLLHVKPELIRTEEAEDSLLPVCRLCAFCHFPQDHPEMEECQTAEFKARFRDSDVPWEYEFSEMSLRIQIQKDWIFIDEEDRVAPSLDDRQWEDFTNFMDLQEL